MGLSGWGGKGQVCYEGRISLLPRSTRLTANGMWRVLQAQFNEPFASACAMDVNTTHICK